jgi:DNA polymerase epsilon subunit 1
MSEGLDPAPEKFPRLPGSHLNFTIPVLEFVKNALVVLELDTDTEGAVHILKKSLLAQVGLEEYATEMKWINPCASFILRDVFCRKCYQCRDVDLCVFSQLEEMNKLEWLCADCQEPYDPEYIELRLIQRIEQNCIRYQLQDLRCSKTQVLSTRLLSRLSIYAENLKTDISRDETYREIRILRNLAEYYRLEWLHETCGRLMHGL